MWVKHKEFRFSFLTKEFLLRKKRELGLDENEEEHENEEEMNDLKIWMVDCEKTVNKLFAINDLKLDKEDHVSSQEVYFYCYTCK